jgi:hypothetical protein
MLLAISMVRIVVLMEQIARDHIATIDANLNNIFLPQNFHVYSLRHKNPRQKEPKKYFVCDDYAMSHIYVSDANATTDICHQSRDSSNHSEFQPILMLDKAGATVKFNPTDPIVLSICHIEGDDALMIQTGSLSVEDFNLRCSVSVNVRHPLEIDIFTLANLNHHKNKKNLKSIMGRWPLICSSIEDSLDPNGHGLISDVSFVVQNSHVITHGKRALSFWIASCRIQRAAVIFQRPNNNANMNLVKRSSCRVLSVTGSALESHHEVLCLEDVIVYLAEDLKYQRVTTHGGLNVTLVSSIGIEAIAAAFDGRSVSENMINVSVNEAVDTIKGFHLARISTPLLSQLKIRSAWRYLLERLSDESIGEEVNGHMLSKAGKTEEWLGPASAAAIASAVRSAVSSSSEDEWTRMLTRLDDTLQHLVALVRIETKPKYARAAVGEVRYVVAAALLGGVLLPGGRVRGAVSSHFMGSRLAREQLSAVLQIAQTDPPASSWLSWLRSNPVMQWLYEFKKYPGVSWRFSHPTHCSSSQDNGYVSSSTACLCGLLDVIEAPAVQRFGNANFFTHEEEDMLSLKYRDDESCAADNSTRAAAGFVLLFVHSKDQLLARDLVSSWYKQCVMCDPAASYQYLIFQSQEDPQATSNLVVLQALEFISRASANPDNDAVVILIGIEAATMFIPPNPSNQGIFAYLPRLAYGKVAAIDGSIVFAAELRYDMIISCASLELLTNCPSPHAFGGRVRDVNHFLLSTLETFGDYFKLRDVVLSRILKYPSSALVDTRRSFFSQDVTTSLASTSSLYDEGGDIFQCTSSNVQVPNMQFVLEDAMI